ncbi:hypothetical protein AXJ14_gp171 [Geobacillus virus E3]|uniref:hypothetical protein n=1 Tax=Geobacillus virus E3 TaxID=1572712 RepID=UPI0006719A14|nr:hypothetical protein AXJ14_gp171 [Geobacillus virus E3]AJA41490.1 hypothetical protein E3_0171 [Geobacillus virus E3]
MNIPYGVCACLYSGVIHEIQYLKSQIQNNQELTETDLRLFNNVKEAVNWYKENCIVSSRYIEEEFAALKAIIINYKNNY